MNWPAVQIEQYKNVPQNMFSTKSEMQLALLGASCPRTVAVGVGAYAATYIAIALSGLWKPK